MAGAQPNGTRAPAPDGAIPRRRILAAAALFGSAAFLPSVRPERSRGTLPSEAEALLPSAHPEQGSSEVENRVEGPLPHRDRWKRDLAAFHAAESALAALAGTADDEAFGRALDRLYRALRRLWSLS